MDESVRVLEGALIRVVAFASLTGKRRHRRARRRGPRHASTPTSAGAAPRPVRTVEEIQERTAAAFDVTVEDLRSPSRAARVAWARQVAMYLSRELTDATLPAIGKAFGRNHTTVMHACKRTAERIADGPGGLRGRPLPHPRARRLTCSRPAAMAVFGGSVHSRAHPICRTERENRGRYAPIHNPCFS